MGLFGWKVLRHDGTEAEVDDDPPELVATDIVLAGTLAEFSFSDDDKDWNLRIKPDAGFERLILNSHGEPGDSPNTEGLIECEVQPIDAIGGPDNLTRFFNHLKENTRMRLTGTWVEDVSHGSNMIAGATSGAAAGAAAAAVTGGTARVIALLGALYGAGSGAASGGGKTEIHPITSVFADVTENPAAAIRRAEFFVFSDASHAPDLPYRPVPVPFHGQDWTESFTTTFAEAPVLPGGWTAFPVVRKLTEVNLAAEDGVTSRILEPGDPANLDPDGRYQLHYVVRSGTPPHAGFYHVKLELAFEPVGLDLTLSSKRLAPDAHGGWSVAYGVHARIVPPAGYAARVGWTLQPGEQPGDQDVRSADNPLDLPSIAVARTANGQLNYRPTLRADVTVTQDGAQHPVALPSREILLPVPRVTIAAVEAPSSASGAVDHGTDPPTIVWPVRFDASARDFADDNALTYTWTHGNALLARGPAAEVAFQLRGTPSRAVNKAPVTPALELQVVDEHDVETASAQYDLSLPSPMAVIVPEPFGHAVPGTTRHIFSAGVMTSALYGPVTHAWAVDGPGWEILAVSDPHAETFRFEWGFKPGAIPPNPIVVTVLIIDEAGQSASDRYAFGGRAPLPADLGIRIDRLNAQAASAAEMLEQHGMGLDPRHGFASPPVAPAAPPIQARQPKRIPERPGP